MHSKQYYYVTGHTSDGFKNYLESNVLDLGEVVVLKHWSHHITTGVLNRFIETTEAQNDIEVLVSPLGYGDLDGVIIRGKSVAVVIDTVMSADLASKLNNVFEIDLEQFTSAAGSEDIHAIMQYYDVLTEEAHAQFKSGLDIHDELEAIYIQEMDFSKADDLADGVVRQLLENVSVRNRSSRYYKRMFGTNTAEGAVNVVPELIAPLSKRFYLKGRAGTGKSHFMKTIMTSCEAHGLDMEVYYCSFDPGSVDMVLIPELDCCIFDSTDPHEFFPENEEDVVIDLYEEAVTPGTDETYAGPINDLMLVYKSHMKMGIQKLREAREWIDDQTVKPSMDRNRTSDTINDILLSELSISPN